MWNISNTLSLSRLVIAIPLCVAIASSDVFGVLIWAFIGMLTDFLDGWAARKFDQVTEFGKVIDPIADKVIVSACALTLLFVQKIPLWWLGLVVIRDLLILGGGIYIQKVKNVTLMSNWLGKWTVASIACGMVFISLDVKSMYDVSLLLSTALMVASFISYLLRFVSVLKSN